MKYQKLQLWLVCCPEWSRGTAPLAHVLVEGLLGGARARGTCPSRHHDVRTVCCRNRAGDPRRCGIGIPADELWHREAKTWCGGGRGRGGSALWHRLRSLAFCVVLGAVFVTWSCSTVVFLVLIFATTRQHMGRSSDDKTVVSMPDYVLEGNNSHNMCVTHRRIRRNENGVPQSSGAVPSKRGFFTPPRRRAQNFEHRSARSYTRSIG